MLASDDIHLDRCFSTDSLWSTRYFKIMQNVGRVKSSVDDLTMERGTVSMRVALVLRSAEVQPLLRDLCDATRPRNERNGTMCALPILPPTHFGTKKMVVSLPSMSLLLVAVQYVARSLVYYDRRSNKKPTKTNQYQLFGLWLVGTPPTSRMSPHIPRIKTT